MGISQQKDACPPGVLIQGSCEVVLLVGGECVTNNHQAGSLIHHDKPGSSKISSVKCAVPGTLNDHTSSPPEAYVT